MQLPYLKSELPVTVNQFKISAVGGEDQFFGDRSGFFQDPFGHLWGVATHVEDVSPKDMEERAKKVTQAA